MCVCEGEGVGVVDVCLRGGGEGEVVGVVDVCLRGGGEGEGQKCAKFQLICISCGSVARAVSIPTSSTRLYDLL